VKKKKATTGEEIYIKYSLAGRGILKTSVKTEINSEAG
jgi:hypothetical protein